MAVTVVFKTLAYLIDFVHKPDFLIMLFTHSGERRHNHNRLQILGNVTNLYTFSLKANHLNKENQNAVTVFLFIGRKSRRVKLFNLMSIMAVSFWLVLFT